MMNQPDTRLMLRDNALLGKNIVVTGGGTGLGRSMTKTFLQLGARVMITSRKEEVLKATCSELAAETGGFITYAVCDVRKMDEVEAAMEKAWTELGPVNVWLNNAAGNYISPT